MHKKEAVIVELDVGNIWAVENMLRHMNYQVRLSSDPEDILSANLAILAGVGSFDAMIAALKDKELFSLLSNFRTHSNGILAGICVGMQVLFDVSEEGKANGLGLIPGKVCKIKSQNNLALRLPHIGWQSVSWHQTSVLKDHFNHEPDWFYFAHSYHCVPEAVSVISAEAQYGEFFACAVEHEAEVLGFQFHPEKSHKFGFELFSALAKYAGVDKV